MHEKELRAALAALPFTVKTFFPAELERVLVNQAKELDRLRQDYAFIRSSTIEGK